MLEDAKSGREAVSISLHDFSHDNKEFIGWFQPPCVEGNNRGSHSLGNENFPMSLKKKSKVPDESRRCRTLLHTFKASLATILLHLEQNSRLLINKKSLLS
jgi:hypothetical protein